MRVTIVDNFPFIDYFQRLIHTLAKDPDNQTFNKVCKNGYQYEGQYPCQFNLVRAMADTYNYLVTELSPEQHDW